MQRKLRKLYIWPIELDPESLRKFEASVAKKLDPETKKKQSNLIESAKKIANKRKHLKGPPWYA